MIKTALIVIFFTWLGYRASVLYGHKLTRKIKTIKISKTSDFAPRQRLYSSFSRFANRVAQPGFAFGTRRPKLIEGEIPKIQHIKKITIALRGAAFRENDEYLQRLSIQSHIEMLIEPIQNKFPGIEFDFLLVSYPENRLAMIESMLQPYGCVNRINLALNIDNQITTFERILNYTKSSNSAGTICSRFDLILTNKISKFDFESSVLSFPWAYPHNFKTGEIADQIHFIGKIAAKALVNSTTDAKLDERWPGTLHNLHNHATHLASPKILFSYLFEIQPPKFKKDGTCEISGNPMKRLGNPSFFYARDWNRLGLDQYFLAKLNSLNRLIETSKLKR